MRPTGKQSVHKPIQIGPAWAVPRLNVPPVRVVKEIVRSTWKHLEDLGISTVPTDHIGLLIGVQVTEAVIQHKYRPRCQPFAVRTDFGWAVAGVAIGIPNPRLNGGFVGHLK